MEAHKRLTLASYENQEQDFYAGCAMEDEGQCQHRASWERRIDEYVWSFTRELPMEKVRASEEVNTPQKARQWLLEEGLWQDSEGRGGTEYYRKMEEWWLRDGDEPITVSLEADGFYWIWGGYHRHAITIANRLETIPAIIGVPKELVRIK